MDTNEGKIKINDNEINDIIAPWQKMIGYVPQTVSVIDESILFNISLESNEDKINMKKINEILKLVDLHDYIYGLPDKIYSLAGENGSNISGGQAQRLGIARALYRNPSIIILDEATSALDKVTEAKILENLFNNKENTIVTISHNKTSLRKCDKIFEIKDSSVNEINLDHKNN